MTWPCATYTTTKQIILKISGDELKDFLEINKNIYNLKEDSEASFDYSFPEWISKPYCKDKVINTETNEEMTMREASGCNSNNLALESYSPGKYSVISEVYDNTANNLLGEDVIEFIVHECQLDEDCSDGNFLTKDVCGNDEIRTCSSSINYVWLISGIVVVILIILIIYFIFRKKE